VTVISDNGTQYSGGTFRTFLLELGIAHRLTRPYTPHAFNTSRHESTRNTPALLNFGRELVVPNAVHRHAPRNAVHHSERLRLLKDTFELVRVNLARAFAKQQVL
jgi:transposase InsO family protein